MLQLNPKNDMAYFTRGLVHDSLGNYRQAAEDYSQYIDVNPNDAIACNNRNHSFDGHNWGFLPGDFIIGQAIVRFYPFNRIGLLPNHRQF